jgi:peptidoglycan/xylan/chitin deacetylase (PgdA/CDA1 family)
MRYIASNYRVLSIKEMIGELSGQEKSGQAVAITFDDGYVGTYSEAYPILRKYSLPVTVYLSGCAIETGEALWYDRIFLCFQKAPVQLTIELATPRTYSLGTFTDRIQAATEVVMYLRSLPDRERQAWCREFEARIPLKSEEIRGAMMTWEQAREMQKGGVDFGAHTMTHPVVSRLQPEDLSREISESKRLIEQRLNSPVDSFAFPFGKSLDCGYGINRVLTSYGFRSAMTSIVGVNEPGADLFRIRRLGIGTSLNIAHFAFQLQRAFMYPEDEEPASSRAQSQPEEISCETT